MLSEAEALAKSAGRQIVVAFQCRAGRHRSVACACLADAYFASLGFESQVRHFALEHDPGKMCRVWACNDCRQNWPVDRRLVERIVG